MAAHRDRSPILQIDRAALQRNYLFMQSLTGAAVRHAAVLKSDAYGLGAAPVAAALSAVGCTTFFVGDPEAALALRASCPDATLIALEGYARDSAAADYERADIVAVANDLEDIAALRARPIPPRYVLNLDTGLNRRGLPMREVTRLYLEGAFRALPPVGLMSHLACAAQPGHPLNELQLARFQQVRLLLRPAWASLAAWSGVWLGQRFHFQLTRLGSALFGLNDPRNRAMPLNQVVRLRAPVLELRQVAAGDLIGYGASFQAARPGRIAIVGMGYAQGLPWATGNRFGIRIGAAVAPVVGRLSMESLCLDVTEVPEELCHAGGWVNLLDERNTLDDLADATGGIAQETLLRLGRGCRREFSAWEYAMIGPAPAPAPLGGLAGGTER